MKTTTSQVMSDSGFTNPIDTLRARVVELEAQLALSEDRNFYLAAENARLKCLPNNQVSRGA